MGDSFLDARNCKRFDRIGHGIFVKWQTPPAHLWAVPPLRLLGMDARPFRAMPGRHACFDNVI